MKAFFSFFAKRSILANVFTVIILLLGISSLFEIKREMISEVEYGIVNIITHYPDASPEDVELNVTNKIEDELNNVDGIDRIESVSMENVSTVNVFVETDVKDPDEVITNIRDAVSRVTDLPKDITGSPLVLEMNTNMIPVIEVGVTGEANYRKKS